MNLAAVEIKAFVPATDFGVSKQFYRDLGFEIPWSSDDLAYVRHGETSFLLQAFDEPGLRRATSRCTCWSRTPTTGTRTS